jgi:hypothetical protein
MNYAVVVAAGLGVFSIIWWYLGARNVYEGPRTSGGMKTVPLVADIDGEGGYGSFDENEEDGLRRRREDV